MARWNATLVLIAVMCLPPQESAGADDSPTAEQAKRAREVRKKLAAPINFNGLDDPDTKLSEALDYLNHITGLTFEVNEQAFKDEMIDDVGNKPLGRGIQKMTGVPPEKVLRLILARIFESSRATFVVRGGVVEITTRRYASPSQWRRVIDDSPDSVGDTLIKPQDSVVPQTSIAFDKRELREALQEIADAAGVNVMVDARAQDKATAPVTATVHDADIDTVLKLLADMAGLDTVLVNDVFYVTTKENAKSLREEKARKAEGRMKAEPAPR